MSSATRTAAMVLLLAACSESSSPKERPEATAASKPTDQDDGADFWVRVTYKREDGGHALPIVRVARARLEQLGMASNAHVRADGDRLLVDANLSGLERAGLPQGAWSRAAKLLTRAGRFEVRAVRSGSAAMAALAAHAKGDRGAKSLGIEVLEDRWVHGTESHVEPYLRASDRVWMFTVAEAKERGCWHPSVAVVQGQIECMVSGREVLQPYLEALAIKKAPIRSGTEQAFAYQRIDLSEMPAMAQPYWRTHSVDQTVRLDNRHVSAAEHRGTGGLQVLTVHLSDEGAAELGRLTTEQTGGMIAIAVDDVVISAPRVDAPLSDGVLVLASADAAAETRERTAADLAVLLNSGPLPSALNEESRKRIAAPE